MGQKGVRTISLIVVNALVRIIAESRHWTNIKKFVIYTEGLNDVFLDKVAHERCSG